MKKTLIIVSMSLIVGCKSRVRIFPYEVGMDAKERTAILNVSKTNGMVQSYPGEPNCWVYFWNFSDTIVQTKLQFEYENSPLDPITEINIDLATDPPGKYSFTPDTTRPKSRLAESLAHFEFKVPDSVCSYKKFKKIYAFFERELGKPSASFQAREVPGNFLTPKVYLDTTLVSYKFSNGNEYITLSRSYHIQARRGEENLYFEKAWIDISDK